MRELGPRRAAGTAVLVPLGLVLLAAAVRLPTLSQQSFWLDEAYTVRLLRLSFTAMLRALPHSESTPPLYYLLARAWARAFGFSEVGLRSLSAVAGIATVPVSYATARRLGGRLSGALAGALVAVSPFLVWFSQEARAYALAALLAAVSLWCLVAYRQVGRDRWLWGWAASAAIGLATHYFVAFVVAPEVAWLLAARHIRRRGPAAPIGLVSLVGAALVPLALSQEGTGHADYIAAAGLGKRLAQVPKQLLIGYASPHQTLTAALAAVTLVLGAGLALARAPAARGRSAIPLSIGAVCVLVPSVLAVAGVDFLNTRNLLPSLPVLLVAAGVIVSAGNRAVAVASTAALAVIFVAVVLLVDANPRYQRSDWRGASRAIGAPGRPRALVVTPASGAVALSPYQPGLRALAGTADVGEIDVIELPPARTGEGVAVPVRPGPGFRIPRGFRIASSRFTGTYGVLRLLAGRPSPVAAAELGAVALGPGGAVTLLQR